MCKHAISAWRSVISCLLGIETLNNLPHVSLETNTNIFTKYSYKIHIKVKDNCGETTFVILNGVAEKLIDTSTFKLLNRSTKDDKDVPSQIESLCGKDFVFKLKLTNFNLKEGLENDTVTKVFVPDEDLELQPCINKEKKRCSYHSQLITYLLSTYIILYC